MSTEEQFSQKEIALFKKYDQQWQPNHMIVPINGNLVKGVFCVVKSEDPNDIEGLIVLLNKMQITCAIKYDIKGIIGVTKGTLKDFINSGNANFAPNLKGVLKSDLICTNIKLADSMEKDPDEIYSRISLEVVAFEDDLNKAGVKTQERLVI